MLWMWNQTLNNGTACICIFFQRNDFKVTVRLLRSILACIISFLHLDACKSVFILYGHLTCTVFYDIQFTCTENAVFWPIFTCQWHPHNDNTQLSWPWVFVVIFRTTGWAENRAGWLLQQSPPGPRMNKMSSLHANISLRVVTESKLGSKKENASL